MVHKGPHPGIRAYGPVAPPCAETHHATTTNHPARLTRGPPTGPSSKSTTFAPPPIPNGPDMLFTTFLLSTAIGAAAVQGAMLLKHKPDAVRTRVPYALLGVAATIAGLIGVGMAMN